MPICDDFKKQTNKPKTKVKGGFQSEETRYAKAQESASNRGS